MPGEVIEYKSVQKTVTQNTNALITMDKEGIVCSWTGKMTYVNNNNYTINFTWNFDWTKLKDGGIDRLTGHFSVRPAQSTTTAFSNDIDWKEGKETITKSLSTQSNTVDFVFEFRLTVHYAEIKNVSYETMFVASDLNDTILVVEGKRLHVNKVFLSIHSDFFRGLFSSNFKEGQLTEIPIKDVSCDDFGLLLSVVYSNNAFPSDKTAEKLLELADRFLMPAVTRQVEHHLLHNSNLPNEKLMYLADTYNNQQLLKKTIRQLDTVQKVKALEKSPERATLSKEAISSVLTRVLQLI